MNLEKKNPRQPGAASGAPLMPPAGMPRPKEPYREFLDASSDMAFLKDKDLRHVFINDAYADFLNMPREAVIGRTDAELLPAELAAGCRKSDEAALGRGGVVVSEETSGDRIFETRKFPVPLEDGRLGVGGLIRDVTDRVRAEDSLRQALKEKEILLREIHHRVKNNLQIVSSLLSLQSRAVRDPAVHEIFQNSQTRIRSMALIHEKLYQSPDMSRVDIGAYVRSLLAHLAQMSGGAASRISWDLSVDDLLLDVNRAVPCGLIISELVVNAMKHAFPGFRTGRVAIAMRAGAEGHFCLRYHDDGVGLPAHVDPLHPASLGLQIVRDLVQQLDGVLEVEEGPGTTFRITC